MNKTTVIALLAGILVGQTGAAHADGPTLTRYDLMEAAALCGILANSKHDPYGSFNINWIKQPVDYRKLARQYADALR